MRDIGAEAWDELWKDRPPRKRRPELNKRRMWWPTCCALLLLGGVLGSLPFLVGLFQRVDKFSMEYSLQLARSPATTEAHQYPLHAQLLALCEQGLERIESMKRAGPAQQQEAAVAVTRLRSLVLSKRLARPRNRRTSAMTFAASLDALSSPNSSLFTRQSALEVIVYQVEEFALLMQQRIAAGPKSELGTNARFIHAHLESLLGQ